jgi:hypothetical protein
MLQNIPSQNDSVKNPCDELRRHDGNIYGILIPFEILLNEELSIQEKLILSLIISFESKGRRCFQTGHTIAEQLNILPSAARRSIARLKELGYITRLQDGRFLVFKLEKVFPSSEAKQNIVGKVTKVRVNSCSMGISKIGGACEESVQHGVTHLQQNVTHGATSGYTQCNMALHEVQHGVTHIKSILPNYYFNKDTHPENQSINLLINKKTDSSDREETEQAVTTQSTRKVSAKKKTSTPIAPAPSPLKKPRPDTEDESLKVRMTDDEWARLLKNVGIRCAIKLCEDFQDYPKAKQYTDHYRTLCNWHKRKVGDGYVWGYMPQGGWAYYKSFLTKQGLKVWEGDDAE